MRVLGNVTKIFIKAKLLNIRDVNLFVKKDMICLNVCSLSRKLGLLILDQNFWWLMLQIKCVDDRLKTLLTDLIPSIMIINHWLTSTSFVGYSNVGDIVMLMTWSWWQFYNVGDRINILVTSFGCWCPTLN